MALMQNIGSALSDGEALMDAAGTQKQVPRINGTRYRSSQVGAVALSDAIAPLVAAGVGVGTALLLIHNEPRRAGSVGKIGTVPKLVIAGSGLALLYFLLKPKQAATTSVPPAPIQSTNPVLQTPSQQSGTTEGNQQRIQLLAIYAGKPNDIAAVNAVGDDTIRKWSLLMGIWQQGLNGYKYDLNGNPTSDYDNSLGKWYEGLAAQYNLT